MASTKLDEGAAAEVIYRELIPLAEQLQRRDPQDLRYVDLVATAKIDLADVYASQAEVSEAGRDFAQCVAHYERAIHIRQQILKQSPNSVEYRNSLAVRHNNVLQPYVELTQPADALRHLNEAIRLHRRNSQEAPEVLMFPLNLANSLINRGLLYKNTSRPDAARESLRAALAVLAPIRSDHPGNETAKSCEQIARRELAALDH